MCALFTCIPILGDFGFLKKKKGITGWWVCICYKAAPNESISHYFVPFGRRNIIFWCYTTQKKWKKLELWTRIMWILQVRYNINIVTLLVCVKSFNACINIQYCEKMVILIFLMIVIAARIGLFCKFLLIVFCIKAEVIEYFIRFLIKTINNLRQVEIQEVLKKRRGPWVLVLITFPEDKKWFDLKSACSAND